MKVAERARAARAPETASPVTAEESAGFVIEEVQMHRFMRYLEKTPPIRFPGQFTVVTGKTGSGKTSILDAITFALYKRTTRTDPPANAKITEICRPGGFTRVAFRQRGKLYEVRRGFTSNGQSYLELTEGGRTIPGTIPEKERAVLDIVGLDYEGFLNSTFVRQEEMKDLGAASGAQRLAVFQKLFRLETFERAARKVSDELDRVQIDVAGKEQEIITRRERAERLPALRAELATLEAEIAERRAREAGFVAKLEEGEKAVVGLAARHDEYTRAESQALEKLGRLQQITARITTLSGEGERAAKLQERIATLEAETKDLTSMTQEGDRLRDLQQRYTILVQQRDGLTQRWDTLQADHDRRLRQLSDVLFAQEKRVAELEAEFVGEDAFSLLRTEGALDERLARIEKELTWLQERRDLVAALKEERAASETDLFKVKARTSHITIDTFLRPEIERQIGELKRQVKEEDDAHEVRLRGLRDEYETLDRKIHEIGFTDEAKKRLADVRQAVGALDAKRNELDDRRKDLEALGDPSARLRDLGDERGTLAAQIEQLRESREALAKDEEAYTAAKRFLDVVKREADELRKVLYTKEGEAKRLAARIEETEAEAAKVDDAQKALADLIGHREVLAVLKNEVFHKKGVVMYAINQLLPELEIEASRNLSELTDGRFSRVNLETFEEAKGHGIRILVGGVDGEWHDVGEFSGGEKTQINAALRFAIAKELASMPQVGRTYGRMRTLFLDEADLGSLDTEVSRDLFVEKLFRMGAFFDKVILITHLTEVADKFPGRIRVEMTPHQVSRAEVLA